MKPLFADTPRRAGIRATVHFAGKLALFRSARGGVESGASDKVSWVGWWRKRARCDMRAERARGKLREPVRRKKTSAAANVLLQFWRLWLCMLETKTYAVSEPC